MMPCCVALPLWFPTTAVRARLCRSLAEYCLETRAFLVCTVRIWPSHAPLQRILLPFLARMFHKALFADTFPVTSEQSPNAASHARLSLSVSCPWRRSSRTLKQLVTSIGACAASGRCHIGPQKRSLSALRGPDPKISSGRPPIILFFPRGVTIPPSDLRAHSRRRVLHLPEALILPLAISFMLLW